VWSSQRDSLIHSTLLPTIITIGLHSGLPNLRKNGHGLFRGMIFVCLSLLAKLQSVHKSNPLDVMRVRITQKSMMLKVEHFAAAFRPILLKFRATKRDFNFNG
jgi:hypothetical protein